MTLDQLRIFVAVAECEHLTKAAQQLNLTPSAVSAALRALEERHQVRLFDRPARRMELTGLGRGFLDEARAVLARARLAETRLADLAGRVAGTLRIAASQTMAAYWLPPRLVTLRARHPEIHVEVGIGNTSQVSRRVQEGDADLGLIEGEIEGGGMTVRTIARDQLMIVAAAGPVYPSLPVLEDLMARDWILREPGSGTRSAFEAGLRRRGFDPRRLNVVLELPSNEAVIAAVAAGGGLTAISAVIAACGVDAGRLQVVAADFVERPLQLLRHGERSLSRAADAFIAACTEDHAAPLLDVSARPA
jgi:DNA-binding transcriptional LysR family regulator